MPRCVSAFAICILVVSIAGRVDAAQTPTNGPLLSTTGEAARIRVLKDAFENHTGSVPSNYTKLKAIVQDFVVRQLQAAPAISDDSLRQQLRRVIGITWTELPDGGLFVKSDTGWGPGSKRRVWAIAYAVFLGSYSPGGIGVVLDSYLWEPEATRLAGRQDADFSGYGLNIDWLVSGPDHVNLLAYGRTAGSNGMGVWKAIVYSCGSRGITSVWKSPTLSGLTAVGRDQLIVLRHAHPCEGAASCACAWTYEVHVLNLNDWVTLPTVTLVSRETRER
jgi:hypothetical protein